MKVFSLSQRFYYKDLDIEDGLVIKNDLILYNSMLHKAFKRVYDHAFKDAKYDESDQKFIKSFYGTSDYLPLSAIHEAKALIKSITLKENLYKKQMECRIQSIDKKIKNKERQLNACLNKKESYIQKSKNKNYKESDYLHEVQVLNPKIKRLKNNIKMLQYRKKRYTYKMNRKMPGVCFGDWKALRNKDYDTYRFSRQRRMLVPGRRQGKYSNNLFKLHTENDVLVYRGTAKEVKLHVVFHKYKKELYERVNEKHNSPNKAVAYELMDYGDYFIIKAILEYPYKRPVTDTVYGSIGIDINVDHIALCETNKDGNIIHVEKIPIHKTNTTNKRNEELYQVAKQICNYCNKKKKTLIVEDLDFKHLKQRMLYENKKRNKVLSGFAYQKILEKIERKCLLNEVDVIRVDPRNTSKIGKEKYSKIKGLGIHYCAAYVIARKGMGFSN